MRIGGETNNEYPGKVKTMMREKGREDHACFLLIEKWLSCKSGGS